MLKGEELSSAYASADVFVMPSETETLGFVALEAMASGLPVVAVAAGGLVDIVTQPGVIGVLAWGFYYVPRVFVHLPACLPVCLPASCRTWLGPGAAVDS